MILAMAMIDKPFSFSFSFSYSSSFSNSPGHRFMKVAILNLLLRACPKMLATLGFRIYDV